jgi:hypothetical protein
MHQRNAEPVLYRHIKLDKVTVLARVCQIADKIRSAEARGDLEPSAARWTQVLHICSLSALAYGQRPVDRLAVDAAYILARAHALQKLHMGSALAAPFAGLLVDRADTLRALSVRLGTQSSVHLGAIAQLRFLEELHVSADGVRVDWPAVEPWALPRLRHLVWEHHDGTFLARCALPALTHLAVISAVAGRACGEEIGAFLLQRQLESLQLTVGEACFTEILPRACVRSLDATSYRDSRDLHILAHCLPPGVQMITVAGSINEPQYCWTTLDTLLDAPTSLTQIDFCGLLARTHALLFQGFDHPPPGIPPRRLKSYTGGYVGLTISRDRQPNECALGQNEWEAFCASFADYERRFQEQGTRLALCHPPAEYWSMS